MKILYDWKIRLKKDCKDFIENKIPEKDYDFEIIYNAYPVRVEGEIPAEVITYVAKKMAKIIAGNPDPYLDFLKYIRINKGVNGVKIYNFIMRDIIKKNPEKYDELLEEVIKNMRFDKSLNKMFDFIVFPLLKKNPEKYIDKVIGWINTKNPGIIKNIFRILCRYIKINNDKAKEIFEKCESFWNIDNDELRNGSEKLLKTIYKIDEEYYQEIYESYKSTYNPNFIEILAHAICEKTEIIEQDIKKWEKSGNTKIKRAGKIARKNLARLK